MGLDRSIGAEGGPLKISGRDASRTLIFDLSEVLIRGLLGVERALAPRFGVPEPEVLRALGGTSLETLCLGRINEDAYWEAVLALTPRRVSIPELRRTVRENFAQPVPRMPELVLDLTKRHRLVLHSDHAAEWIDDVLPMHPFLSEAFESMFFSYALGSLKTSAASFHAVLRQLGEAPRDCLFIDDNPANVATALSIGLPSIPFQGASALRVALDAPLDGLVP